MTDVLCSHRAVLQSSPGFVPIWVTRGHHSLKVARGMAAAGLTRKLDICASAEWGWRGRSCGKAHFLPFIAAQRRRTTMLWASPRARHER